MMSDAPERIWVAPWREGDWSEGDWDDNDGKTLNDKPCIQYVRADRIEALTAKLAKVLQAAEPLAAMAERYDPEDDDGDLECWSGLAVPKIKHIRALRAAILDLKIEQQE
jgi:hypothetical protein